MPPRGATRSQLKRYQTTLHAWCVGTALREYAKTLHSFDRYYMPDELRFLSSPRLDFAGSGRRLAENGTPVTMEDVVAHIDRQAKIMKPIARAYENLRDDAPQIADFAWKRHVDLWTIEEIATRHGVSERTVIRHLGVANLRLMAAIEARSGTRTGTQHARQLDRQSEEAEAAWHRTGYADRDLTNDDRALAGVEYREDEGKRRKRR